MVLWKNLLYYTEDYETMKTMKLSFFMEKTMVVNHSLL